MIHADMIISTSETTDDNVYLDVIIQYIKCKLQVNNVKFINIQIYVKS